MFCNQKYYHNIERHSSFERSDGWHGSWEKGQQSTNVSEQGPVIGDTVPGRRANHRSSSRVWNSDVWHGSVQKGQRARPSWDKLSISRWPCSRRPKSPGMGIMMNDTVPGRRGSCRPHSSGHGTVPKVLDYCSCVVAIATFCHGLATHAFNMIYGISSRGPAVMMCNSLTPRMVSISKLPGFCHSAVVT